MLRLTPILFLAACAPATTLIEPDRPYDGKYTPPAAERPSDEFNTCPVKSPRYGKPVKPGHEDVLCYTDDKPTPEPEEPTECTDAGQWIEGRRYALYQKVCA